MTAPAPVRLALFLGFVLVMTVFPATYYVSKNGDDTRSAAEAQNLSTPWKSLSKVSTTVFAPGDQVLFKKGEAWEGTLVISSSGTADQPVTYGSYGSGANPVIKGTVSVAGPWTRAASGIYEATVNETVTALFLDGEPLTLARYPNSGWLTITDTLNPTILKCDSLNSVNWTGAALHVRTQHWTIASKKVTACNTAQKTLTVSAAPVYGLKPGWGFFLNNALAALDTAGEWFYDSLAHKLHVRLPGDASPAGRSIEGSAYRNGVEMSGKSNIRIAGFTISGHRHCAAYGNGVSGLRFTGNTLRHPDGYGIYIHGNSLNNRIDSNVITGPNLFGILLYSPGATVAFNTVRRVALLPQITASGLGDHCCSGLAMEIHGDNVRVANNRIDSIGYIGIRSFDASCVIEYNYITNCCVTKDDGGGIYTGWQSSRTATGAAGTVIRRNIVTHTRSAPRGTPGTGYTPGEGIYVDDQGHGITLEDNTTAFCSNNGLFLHNNKDMVVRRNVSYNNPVQLRFAEDAIVGAGYAGNNRATGNTLYSCGEGQICFSTTSAYTDSNLGFTDSNRYCNPYSDMVIKYNSTPYSLGSWQAAKGLDAHSTVSRVRLPQYTINDTTGSELIANGAFRSNVNGWGFWPAAVSTTWDTGRGLDSGCLKVLYRDDSASSSCLVYPNASFSITAGQAYRLGFSAVSNKPGTLEVILRQAHTPWGGLGFSRSFIMTDRRQDYSAVFIASAADAQARIDFSNTRRDSLVWLDNISLLPVRVTAQDPLRQSVLFFNPTMRDSVVSLSGTNYRDLDGNPVAGSVTLVPFASVVLVADTGTGSFVEAARASAGLPFSASVLNLGDRFRVTLDVSAADYFSLAVYDIRGRLVSRLFGGPLSPGCYRFDGRAGRQTQGLIFLRIRTDAASRTAKICLVR